MTAGRDLKGGVTTQSSPFVEKPVLFVNVDRRRL